MWVTVILVFTSVILCVYFGRNFKEHYKKYEKFYQTATPLYIPILGNTYLFFGNKNMLTVSEYMFNTYGKKFAVYLPHRIYFTSVPEEIQIILNEAMDKPREYDHLRRIFGNSLLMEKSATWKKNRRILSKGFKQNILDTFVSVFNEKSRVLVNILKRNQYDNIYDIFEQLTLDIFHETNLSTKSSILLDGNNSFVQGITEGQRLLYARVGNIWKMIDFIFFNMPQGRRVLEIIDHAYKFLEPSIVQRKKKMQQEIVLNSKELPLLDLLLHSAEKEQFTDAFIATEMMLFASAATETTAYSLAYNCCMLGMHPEVQQKVYEEVMSIIGDGEITPYHLSQLKYTEMALNESMRLLPPIPIVGRISESDLDIGSCVIPKHTTIGISSFRMHRDGDLYPDPLKYDPDRFLPENVAKRHPYSFIPFLGGPRNCIGWKYAQMSMKVTIASIIRKFELHSPYKSVSEIKCESSVVMYSTHPLEISFIPRNL